MDVLLQEYGSILWFGESSPTLMVINWLIVVLWLYVYLPVKMARKRGRSGIVWVLLFWTITPILGIVLLLILGDSRQKRIDDKKGKFPCN